MARHRKTPAARHQAPGHDDGPASSGAPERRFSAAMRRVVVTPTFAAGLGVVVAAVLAYPMQTVFSYVAPGAAGRGGLACTQGGCAHQSGRGKPAPFGVGGGTLTPSSPGSAEPGNDGPPASPGQQAGGGTAIAEPRLSYKITSTWRGGFWGQITIMFPGSVPARWRLRIGYPPGPGPAGRTFAVGVGVQGRPAHPGKCSFNGRACHFG